MPYQARFVASGPSSVGQRRYGSVLCVFLWCSLWLVWPSGDTWAWTHLFVNGYCEQTGEQCRATITNRGGLNGCCDPASPDVSVCAAQRPCRGLYGYHWPQLPVSWSINLNNMASQAGFSKLDGQILTVSFQQAWNAWVRPTCTSFQHKFLGTTSTRPNPLDKKTVMYLATEQEWAHLGVGPSTLAFSNPTPDSQGRLSDGDIVFNPKPGAPWGAHPKVDKSDLDITDVAVHEVGHTLGLGHSHETSAVMYYTLQGGGPQFKGLGTDDQTAICTIYPATNKCQSDTSCGPCRACLQGACQPANPAQPQTCKACTTDQNCGPNSKCVEGPAGKRCLQLCVKGCCPEGYRCTTTGNLQLCTPLMSVCPAISCSQDTDCGTGGKCLTAKGECVAPNPPYAPQQCNRKCSADSDCAPNHKCVQRIPGQAYCAPACSPGLLCPKGLHCRPTATQGNVCTPTDPFFCPCENNADCPFGQVCQKELCQSANGEVLFAPCNEKVPCREGLQCVPTNAGYRCLQPCNPGVCPQGTTCQPNSSGLSICVGTPTREIGQSCDNLQFRCKSGLICARLQRDALAGYCVETCSLSQGCKSGGACNMQSTGFRYCECGANDSCGAGRTCRQLGVAPNQIKLCVCNGPSCPDLCNNQVCDADRGENCSNCPDDCTCSAGQQCVQGSCQAGSASCGNGTCDSDENCSTCPTDCACPQGQKCLENKCQPANCGNNTCDSGENCSTCPTDCACPAGESCQNGQCVPPANQCGNGVCDSNESCANCAADCACPAGQTCQNGTCQVRTNCGNNTCDSDENCSTCPTDCACGAGQQCRAGVCRSDGTVDVCGNNVCEINVGENCSTCEADCRCPSQHICQAGICRPASSLCPPEQQKEVCDPNTKVCQIECQLKGCSCDQTQSPNHTAALLLLVFALLQLAQRVRRRSRA